ncbi:hypothetical protein [Streptomyces sp. HPF1205]|uniref:hypothetical protein n=1 Tax=Streptomyces sp. HPF1205 TaxID=2873262 RepID=UPI001CED9E8D|nr:hypothetical protein [Streptomyces sp. HPF1205]
MLAVEIAWVIRDLKAVGLHDTLWTWLGLLLPGNEHGLLATGGLDAVLIVVLAGALVASRRPSAGWAFVAAGLFAAVYRLPEVWIFTADWTKGAPLHDRALSTGIGFVVAGIALIVLGLAGRRPADAPPPGPYPAYGAYQGPAAAPAPYGGGGAATGGQVPARPGDGPAVVAGLLALALALELTGWQFYYVQKYNDPGYGEPHLYKHLITGERTIEYLLAAPTYYGAWAAVALGVVLAVAALARAPLARTLGTALGFLVALNAVISLDAWHKERLLFKDGIPTFFVAQQGFEIGELVAGLLLLVLLIPKAGGPRPAPAPAWGPPPAGGFPHPPQAPPPPAYGGAADTPGAFGPPPNLPPNLPPQQSQPPQRPPASYGYPPSAPPSTPPRTPPNAPPPPAEPPRGQ